MNKLFVFIIFLSFFGWHSQIAKAAGVQSFQFSPFNGVSLTLNADRSPINPVVGDQVIVSWTLINNSATENLTEVVLTFTLPSGFSYVSCSFLMAGTCSNTGQTVTYNIGDLAALGSSSGGLVFNINSGYGTQNVGIQISGLDSGDTPFQSPIFNWPFILADAPAATTATPTVLPATGVEFEANDWQLPKLISYFLLPQTATFFHL